MIWEEASLVLIIWVFLTWFESSLCGSPPCSGWAAFMLWVASLKDQTSISDPQIFRLTFVNSLCSVCTFWFYYPSQKHVRSSAVVLILAKYFWNQAGNKGLMFQMCFVWSVYRAEGLWQEQLTLCFNSLGKNVWEQRSGKLFSCCSQGGKTPAIQRALGRTVTVLGTARFCSSPWVWRGMNRLHGERDSLLPHLLFLQRKKPQTYSFSQFTYWE